MIATLSACAAGMLLSSRTTRLQPVPWFVDAFSLGALALSGIQRAEELRLSPMSALFLGVVTGTAGGLTRDVLCREMPELLVPGFPYATAALCGGVVYFGATRGLGLGRVPSEWLAISASFALRALGTWRGWVVPRPADLFSPPPRRGRRSLFRRRSRGEKAGEQ